jgi:hypothetical protein
LVREGRDLGYFQQLVESGFDEVKISLEFVIDGFKFIPDLVLKDFKFGIDRSNVKSQFLDVLLILFGFIL